MILNDVGKIANDYLMEIPNHFPNVELGEFIIMPNHVHCILIVGARHVVPQHGSVGSTNQNQFSKPVATNKSAK